MDTSTEMESGNRGDSGDRRDRRIARTKKYLRSAVLDLTVERGEFNSIQIIEITERANVARSTFYLHYSDKEELLYDALQCEFNQLMMDIQDHYQNRYAPIHLSSFLRYVYRNPRYFQVVLTCVGTTRAFEQTRSIIESWLAGFIDFSLLQSSVPGEVLTYHISNSVLNMVRWWLGQEEDIPPETVERYCMSLLFDGVLKTVGLESKQELDEEFWRQVVKRGGSQPQGSNSVYPGSFETARIDPDPNRE